MPWLHHALVHFPIAFAVVAAVLASIAALRPSAQAREHAKQALVLAVGAALGAAVPGLLSAGHFVESGGASHALGLHRNAALVGLSFLLLSATIGWSAHRRPSRALNVLTALSVVAGSAVLLYAAQFGGELLHDGLSPWSIGGHSHSESHADAHESGSVPRLMPSTRYVRPEVPCPTDPTSCGAAHAPSRIGSEPEPLTVQPHNHAGSHEHAH